MKRNRIICPGVAVNGQLLPGKSKFLVKLFEKYRNFSKIRLEKSISCVKLPEKINFLENLPGKIEIFFTWIHDPQISNQIDAADKVYEYQP